MNPGLQRILSGKIRALDRAKNNLPGVINRTRLCGQNKKAHSRRYGVLSGEALRKRRLSSFKLDALMVVEVGIAVNHLVGLRKRSRFVPVNALCFED